MNDASNIIVLFLRNLKQAENQIEELSLEVADVDQKVTILKEKLNKSTKEATEVEFHLNKAKETIDAARSLVSKLEGEYNRWSQQVSELGSSLKTLPKEALLGASFITYLSNAPEDVRKAMLNLWSKSLDVDNYDLSR